MKTRSFARALEGQFDEADRTAGRALFRRRRVHGKAVGAWFAADVRGPEGPIEVMLTPDERAVAMSCPCRRFGARGSCAHAFAALLALDRQRRSAADRGAHAGDDGDRGVGHDGRGVALPRAGPRELGEAAVDDEPRCEGG